MNIPTLAAIDVGSNAVRLLICGVESGEKYRKLAFLRVPVRLGEDVFTTGRITDERAALLHETMCAFSHLIKAYGVTRARACATSAMREAANGADIVAAVERNSGIALEIISGAEEARLIAAADTSRGEKGDALHVDVGGGSTEVVIFRGGHITASHSFRLGTVRILDRAVKKDDAERFEAKLKAIGAASPGLPIVASGGNINKAQKLLDRRAGDPIDAAELKALYDALARLTPDRRIKEYKLNPYRADVIVPALKIFLTVGKLCRAGAFIVPRIGLVDGIVAQLRGEI